MSLSPVKSNSISIPSYYEVSVELSSSPITTVTWYSFCSEKVGDRTKYHPSKFLIKVSMPAVMTCL